MDRDDALRILGLKDGCTAEEIRKAYKEQSFAWHPDRFEAGSSMQERAAEKMKEINAAYAVLTGKAQSSRSRTNDKPDVFAMEHVIYLGTDPRLGNLGRQKPSVVIALTSDGLLVRFGQDQIQGYPVDQILGVARGNQHHASKRAALEFESYSPKDHSCAGNELVLQAADPEKIEPLLIARFRFENEYLAERFAKRVRELCCPRNVGREYQAYLDIKLEKQKQHDAEQQRRDAERAAEVDAHIKGWFLQFFFAIFFLVVLGALLRSCERTEPSQSGLRNSQETSTLSGEADMQHLEFDMAAEHSFNDVDRLTLKQLRVYAEHFRLMSDEELEQLSGENLEFAISVLDRAAKELD